MINSCATFLTRRIAKLSTMPSSYLGMVPFAAAVTTVIPLSRNFSASSEQDTNQQQWKKWQHNLLQTDESAAPKKKKRGGKSLRKREALKSATAEDGGNRLLDAGSGQFPPLRFSDEETERLLAEAYAGIPERGISKGTRRIKRQKNRFFGIRKAASIKKAEKIAHHFDNMEKRSKKVQDILKMKEIAVETKVEDKEYQLRVLQKWSQLHMIPSKVSIEADSGAVTSD
mmetsp:Transcript_24437/g.37366  ORF Transcript_24437/g.37366 Transcript_24437/m.37366 type:complete len:228 (-) Transcript_24437:71-754(-)|eukprot:CAMPEP_0194086602 /NCGR_PEP_ID=MMETSP0149-20130528/21742_1 /TAXON_ID=122233 /ORGANISM="Chaetoceros debilis, Strain MM31A-1" /LENGTH=227 /DNA_ID=CAMNT_0038769721 /DNA_START=91 /DNA_END=774 /DNA_ORIENTATION=-